MKREIPILLTVICGLLVTLAYFAPAPDPARGIEPSAWQAVNSELLDWATILVAVGFLLGIANLVRINLKQIAAKHPDTPYKAVLLLSMGLFLLFGMAEMHVKWLWTPLLTHLVPSDSIERADGTRIEGYVLERGDKEVTLRTAPDYAVTKVPADSVKSITKRSLKIWIYDKFFAPLQATMFSLLAFYIASAAFRAFRARSVEATLLLAAGAIVMLGQVPLGDELTFGLATPMHAFLMGNVVKAGQRAIIIGASLGVLATGLRIVLGLERSYLSE
jgi:hypothetical protein